MAKRNAPKLPKTLKVERRGAVAILTLARPEKRNALNDATVLGLEAFFETLPAGVKVEQKWRGPCPPGGKVHHYVFTLQAFDGKDLVGQGRLVGTYQR